MNLEVGDIIICTVDRIVGTVVFVKMHGVGIKEGTEGSIIFSEVAPGRIRNIRDYIVPKKKIVCKVLRISGNHVDLSLRRVTQKEKKEMLEQEKQEKSYTSILKRLFEEEKTKKIINDILAEEKLFDFFQEVKENPKKLEKIMSKEDSQKLLEILKTQKQKKAIVKKEISLTTTNSEGLELIKKILSSSGSSKDTEIKYISAGKYSLKAEAEDLKSAGNKIKEIIEEIEKSAKKHGMEFSVKEK